MPSFPTILLTYQIRPRKVMVRLVGDNASYELRPGKGVPLSEQEVLLRWQWFPPRDAARRWWQFPWRLRELEVLCIEKPIAGTQGPVKSIGFPLERPEYRFNCEKVEPAPDSLPLLAVVLRENDSATICRAGTNEPMAPPFRVGETIYIDGQSITVETCWERTSDGWKRTGRRLEVRGPSMNGRKQVWRQRIGRNTEYIGNCEGRVRDTVLVPPSKEAVPA